MTYDVYGVGNSLVDIQARVSDEVIGRLGVHKGAMTLVDETIQHRVRQALDGVPLSRCAEVRRPTPSSQWRTSAGRRLRGQGGGRRVRALLSRRHAQDRSDDRGFRPPRRYGTCVILITADASARC